MRKPRPISARWKKLWKDWCLPLLVVFLVLGSFRSAVADWLHVPTGSMLPTIVQGDRIFVHKAAYDLRIPFTGISLARLGEPEPGDVILFRSPEGKSRLVKRVIGIPGDEIEVRGDRVLVNGGPLPYEPCSDPRGEGTTRPRHRVSIATTGDRRHPVMTTPSHRTVSRFGPVVVPEGHYFVMGDHRDDSRDSRSFGFVDRAAVLGRAIGIAFSLDPDRGHLPRFGRTATSIP